VAAEGVADADAPTAHAERVDDGEDVVRESIPAERLESRTRGRREGGGGAAVRAHVEGDHARGAAGAHERVHQGVEHATVEPVGVREEEHDGGLALDAGAAGGGRRDRAVLDLKDDAVRRRDVEDAHGARDSPTRVRETARGGDERAPRCAPTTGRFTFSSDGERIPAEARPPFSRSWAH
jgi:hypothetical protein